MQVQENKKIRSWEWDLFPVPPLLVVSHKFSPGPLASFCSIPAPVVQEGSGAAGGWVRWAADLPGCPGKEQLHREDGSSCGYEISHSMKKWI